MGSLSNLYISQSYTSLIHLGSDTSVTTASVELQDGLGNGIGVFVNSLGNVSITGILSASNIPADIVSEAELNAYTASTNARLNNIESTTASLNIAVTNINAFSASQITKDATLATYTASVNSKFDSVANSTSSLNAFSASQLTKDTTLASVTASLQQQLTNIGAQSGSWVTESETGSFARTDVTNTFTQPQIISAAVTASAARIANLNYPTADNGAESFIQTNGAGTLSLQYVKTMYQNIRNRESVSIAKGTPLYASGSTGDNVDVFIADAGNPLRMPATLIAGDTTLASGATGKGIIFGHIEGVNTTGFTAGTAVYVAVGGGWTSTRPTGSTTPIQPLGIVTREGVNGMGIVMTETPVTLPNIQTGYAWVGNGSNFPVAVATSSFSGGGGSADLTSLNAFTASQFVSNSFFATTGSNTFNGNQIINGTLLVTGSSTSFRGTAFNVQDNTGTNKFLVNTGVELVRSLYPLEVQAPFTASLTEGYVWVGNASGVSTLAATSSFVTTQIPLTSLNAYTASQDTKNSTLASYTASVNISLNNINAFTQSIIGTNAWTASIDTKFATIATQSGSWGGGANLTSLNAYTASNDTKWNNLQPISGTLLQTASFANNTLAFTKLDGGPVNIVGIASTGSNTFIGDEQVVGIIQASDANIGLQGFAPTVFQGVGTTAVAYDQFVNAGNYDAIHIETNLNAGTKFQDYNGSGLNTWMQIPANTGSNPKPILTRGLEVTGSTEVGTFTASLQNGYVFVGGANGRTNTLATSSFATTGSNTFIGNQTISGSVRVTGSVIGSKVGAYDFDSLFYGSQLGGTIANGTFFGYGSTSYEFIVGAYAAFDNELKITANSSGVSFGDFNGSTYPTWLQLNPNPGTNPKPIMTRGLEVTGSTEVGTFTASLQQGYVWVGNANGRTTTVATSSFGGGGGATFPYTGNAVITGSLGISGSMFGGVIALSVTSATASVDFSAANMFTLTLPSASTLILPTNVRAGQTVNIQITQPTPGTGSVTFPSAVKFAGGNDYQATATGSAIDMLTLVSYDGVNVLGTSIKNFI